MIVKIYVNSKRDPQITFRVTDAKMIKHQIANQILLKYDTFEDVEKIRIKIEGETDGNE